MSVLARIVIIIIVGPGVGAVAGEDLAHLLGSRAGQAAGDIARWEMSGLLAGVLAGALFAILAIRCTVGSGGRLRGRIADRALLPVGILAVLALLAGQRHAPADVVSALRWAMIAAWLLGLLLLLTSLRYRPPVPVPPPPPEEPVRPPPEQAETGAQPAIDESTWERYVSEEYRDE